MSEYWASLVINVQADIAYQHKDTCGWQICASNEQIMSEYWASLVSTVQVTIAYLQANASKVFNHHKDTCGWQICASNEHVMSK